MGAEGLIQAARDIARCVAGMRFAPPVTYVYRPLEYAWEPHEDYLTRWGRPPKRVVFLGMNPGPWGMAQTGVPFGEVNTVREWLGVDGQVGKPPREHPKRPVQGLACPRSEVSGRRLWSLFSERFGRPEEFFQEHFVANYCPLVFMEETGRNRTPDKLPAGERRSLVAVCDEHLRAVCAVLEPEFVVGVGRFAAQRAAEALDGTGVTVVWILHPSPASPLANRGWGAQATRRLRDLGIW